MGILFKLRKILSKIPFLKKFCLKLLEMKSNFSVWHNSVYPVCKFKMLHPKSPFLVFTPTHDNLGDHAIAFAEKKVFDSLGVKYFEVSEYQLRKIHKLNKLNCFNGKPVFLHGGGYLGTIWFDCELLLRELIEANPESKFLALPNTIYYDDTDFGKSELEKSAKIYNSHKNLHFYAREKYSFKIMKEIYNSVSLSPDIVLSLNESENFAERSGCLLCLRNDKEKTLNSTQWEAVERFADTAFSGNFTYTDMSGGGTVRISDREAELNKKFSQFRSAELVITDRLHGMIFCAVTGTPCIVLNSQSHKVKGCYEWIKDLEYIHFADDTEQISEIYKSIPGKVFVYDNKKFDSMFDELKKDILKTLS